MRLLLQILGSLSLVTGVVGIFVPVLPTTPFLLLAAACYARSSVRFYNYLMNQKQLGPYIRSWRRDGTVPLRAKIMAISLIVITIGSSIWWFIPLLPVKVLVGAIGVAVIIYLIRLPTKPSSGAPKRGTTSTAG